MDHADARARLDAYLDDELDATTALQLERHLDGCAECTRVLAEARALRVELRAALPYHAASDTLRARVRETLRVTAPAGPVVRAGGGIGDATGAGGRGFMASLPMAAAAALVAVAGTLWVTGAVTRATALQTTAREAVADHVRSLLAEHLTDVRSTNQHVVKPWFDGRLDFAPPVRDLAEEGYPLIGGRLDRLGDRTVAALVYARGRHTINVFVWPGAGDVAPTPVATIEGYHVVRERRDGMERWLVSDLNEADLLAFARRLDTTPKGGAEPVTP